MVACARHGEYSAGLREQLFEIPIRLFAEALDADDQETVIKIIDAMIFKQRMASALAPVDAAA